MPSPIPCMEFHMGFLIFIVVLTAIGITLYLKRDVIGQWLENIFD